MNMNRLQIKLFNTKTAKKEVFEPQSPPNVKLYTCGPTVYDYAHIGNLRTYVAEDLLKRVLIFLGYKVKHVMNLTDVDDKTIKGALREQVSLEDYTQTFKDAFFDDLKTLHILPANQYPAATDHIGSMIEMIETLLTHQIAYKGQDGSIYFSIEKFPEYGALSHLDTSSLKQNASKRIESDEYEKDVATDFVLWKKYDPNRDGSIYWESPFGPGRPGWHLECSAMALNYLGPTLDLHMGGVDNIFPHHENEIAQSQACTHQNFCPFWVHVEHLLVENKKMSKSLGNFYTLRDLLEKSYTPLQIRYLLLSTHYKTQLNFTFEGLKGAKSAVERLQNFVDRLQRVDQKEEIESVEGRLDKLNQAFKEALCDDLNISSALASLFDFIREINPLLDDNKISQKQSDKILGFFKEVNHVLALLTFDQNDLENIPKELIDAMNARQKAREAKDWSKADELRDFILEQGYLIEDSSKGPVLKKKT